MPIDSLSFLLFGLPLLTIAVLATPANHRCVTWGIGGLVLCLCCGWQVLAWTAAAVLLAWATMRCMPETLRLAFTVSGIGIGLQALCLLLGVWQQDGIRLPLLIAIMQNMLCILQRMRRKIETPTLPHYLLYAVSALALLSGNVQAHTDSVPQCHPYTLQQKGKAVSDAVTGIFQIVIVSIPMQTIWNVFAEQIPLTQWRAIDVWIVLLVFHLSILYGLSGISHIAAAIAVWTEQPPIHRFAIPDLRMGLQYYLRHCLCPFHLWVKRIIALVPQRYRTVTHLLCCMLLGTGLASSRIGSLWGAAIFGLLRFEDFAAKRWPNSKLRPTLQYLLAHLMLLLCAIPLCCRTNAQWLGMTTALLTRHGLLCHETLRYLCNQQWYVFLLCIAGLFPIRLWLQNRLRTSKSATVAGVILIPAVQLFVILLCITQLLAYSR